MVLKAQIISDIVDTSRISRARVIMDSGDVLYVVCNDLRRVSISNEFGVTLIEGRSEGSFFRDEMAYRYFGQEEPFLRIVQKFFRKPTFSGPAGDISYQRRNCCRGGMVFLSFEFSWYLPFNRLERKSPIKADSATSFDMALATFHFFWIRLYLSS